MWWLTVLLGPSCPLCSAAKLPEGSYKHQGQWDEPSQCDTNTPANITIIYSKIWQICHYSQTLHAIPNLCDFISSLEHKKSDFVKWISACSSYKAIKWLQKTLNIEYKSFEVLLWYFYGAFCHFGAWQSQFLFTFIMLKRGCYSHICAFVFYIIWVRNNIRVSKRWQKCNTLNISLWYLIWPIMPYRKRPAKNMPLEHIFISKCIFVF